MESHDPASLCESVYKALRNVFTDSNGPNGLFINSQSILATTAVKANGMFIMIDSFRTKIRRKTLLVKQSPS